MKIHTMKEATWPLARTAIYTFRLAMAEEVTILADMPKESISISSAGSCGWTWIIAREISLPTLTRRWWELIVFQRTTHLWERRRSMVSRWTQGPFEPNFTRWD